MSDFYTSQGLWRNDLHPERAGDAPPVITMHSIAVCAKDGTAQEPVLHGEHYALVICHVMAFHGRGFMPRLCFYSTESGNGGVHYGTDQEAYDAAVEEGRQLVEQNDAKLNEKMEARV